METLGRLVLTGKTARKCEKDQACEIERRDAGWCIVSDGEVVCLCKEQTGKRKGVWAGGLLEALGWMSKHRPVVIVGKVLEMNGEEASILFDITAARGSFKTHQASWPKSKQVARVFAAMHNAQGILSNIKPVSWDRELQLHQSSVADLFKEMPTVEVALEEMHKSFTPSCWLEDLPVDLLVSVMQKLDPASFRALASCSRMLHVTAMEAIPGLKTTLCDHQRNALKWMILRERDPCRFPHPYIKRLVTLEGLLLHANTVTGELSADVALDDYTDCRGGILADEPGLGKTVTILSLVMRTKGLIPQPPKSAVVVRNVDGQGRQGGYYVLNKTELPAFGQDLLEPATPTRRRSLTRRLSRTPNSGIKKKEEEKVNGMDSTEQVLNVGTPVKKEVGRKRPRTRSSTRSTVIEAMGEYCGNLEESSQCGSEKEIQMDLGNQVDNWVQCDGCKKWRHLPPMQKVDVSCAWYCSMHPDPNFQSCRIPEALCELSEVAQETGYIAVGALYRTNENIEHFSELLGRFHHLIERRAMHKALVWLLKQIPDSIVEGVTVPTNRRKPPGYEELFEALGLEQIQTNKRRRGKELNGPSHCWRMPVTYRALRLDIPALSDAVEIVSQRQQEVKVHLSSATLVVLPAILIEQWKGQIDQHFPDNKLRVKVLTVQSQYPQHAHELAHDYDLVLTTFNHLSSEWTKESSKRKRESSMLLEIHWLRVILDEGHIIASNLCHTNRNQMVRCLRADYRWVMTGTPTPNTPTSHVGYLFPLLAFLRQQPYGLVKRNWEEAVQRPFEAGLPEGRERLMQVLRRIMIRASKAQLRLIPSCKKTVSLLDFERDHAVSFNELVEVIQRNIVLADWGEEGHKESLINPENAKWSREMVNNLRLSCCVAGNSNLRVNEVQLKETLQLLAERLRMSDQLVNNYPWTVRGGQLSKIAEALRRGTDCQKCYARIRLPIVTPCGHLLCTDCIAQDRFKCPLPHCNIPYKMQDTDHHERTQLNPNPEHPVPVEVIEWQPSFAQKGAVGISGGEWSANWEATKSSKCEHLVKRLREIGVMGENGGVPKTKAIVFTLFWQHLSLIRRSLMENGIPFCVLRKSSDRKGEREMHLEQFRTCRHTGVLLMDVSGAVGLDLSMASWVFLMEPVADKSLEEQIISRAHRMGGESTVNVELLVMRGSAEEKLLQLYDDQVSNNPQSPTNNKRKRSEDEGRSLRNALLLHIKRAKLVPKKQPENQIIGTGAECNMCASI